MIFFLTECPVFNTTDVTSYDWRLPPLGNLTLVEFSVWTPINTGVWIALNKYPEENDGMYEIGELINCDITL